MSGAFWGAADDSESIRVIHQALDLGVTLVDTAEAYGWGHAEEVVGRALAGRRQQAVIATKAAPNHLEPAEAVKALEGRSSAYRRIMSTSISSTGRIRTCRSARRWTRSSDCGRRDA
jgi:aryl-alcohol dehydrogenase-like predicted oxidoreductase